MKRVLLKLSGEALARKSGNLYDHPFVNEVAATVAGLLDEGYQIALVVGAGNIWRGREGVDMDRIAADRMGMLATVINAIYLRDAIERAGKKASVMTSVPMVPFAESYSSEGAIKHLEAGEVVIFGAGLGIPFLSTDTTGAVRAAEIGADAMLMAKNVDYIYTDDPRKNPNAEKLERVNASDVLRMNLKAIDSTATAFCMSGGMPIRVFGLREPEDILRALRGEALGTVIDPA
jgi:uridylate kinase